MIRGGLQLFVAAAILLAPTALGVMEVNMSCDREAFTAEDCAKPAHKGTKKTADALMLETFSNCAEDATDKWFRREFFALDAKHADGKRNLVAGSEDVMVVNDDNGSRNLVGSQHQEPRNLGVCDSTECISCQSACCLLGYCAGTCGCGCTCGRRRLGKQVTTSDRDGSHLEFIGLMEGAQVQTSLVENSISAYCTSAVQRLAEKMEKYGNRCMGDSNKIRCYGTAFTT
jgi:hypothetical protein